MQLKNRQTINYYTKDKFETLIKQLNNISFLHTIEEIYAFPQ